MTRPCDTPPGGAAGYPGGAGYPDTHPDPAWVARSFGLPGASLSPLAGGLSGATWRVDAGARAMVLRRNARATEPPGHVRSGLAWLAALSGTPGVRTPVPCPRADGEVEPVVTPGDGHGPATEWTLVGWVPGHTLDRLPDEDEVRQVGLALAALHRRARDWAPARPAWFARPRYDGATLRRAAATLLGWRGTTLGEADRATLAAAVGRAVARLEALLATPGETGLIHTDIHDGNVVFTGDPADPPGVIDFGRAGFGPWALDLAMAQHYLTEDLAASLAGAYLGDFPLSGAAVEALPDLRLLAAVENLAILSGFPGEEAFVAAELADLVERARERAHGPVG